MEDMSGWHSETKRVTGKTDEKATAKAPAKSAPKKTGSSKKAPKSDTVGHNVNREDAVIQFQLSKFRAAKKKKASADGEYSSFLSHLEAKGVDKDAAKAALSIIESGKAAETLEHWSKVARYCRLLGLPLESDQLNLFSTGPGEQTPEEKASEQGFGAGVLGLGQDECPHSFESPLGQAWLAAWNKGCAFRHGLEKEEGEQVAEEQAEEADDGDNFQADIEDAA